MTDKSILETTLYKLNKIHEVLIQDDTEVIKENNNLPKILCLHGGGQSALQFKSMKGTQDLINALPEYNFHFVNSPLSSNVWWNDPIDKNTPTTDPDHPKQSVDFLSEYIKKNGPFEGILGYSQGAAMIITLLAYTELKFEKILLFTGYLPTTHLGIMKTIENSKPLKGNTCVFAGIKDSNFYSLSIPIPELFEKKANLIIGENTDHSLPLKSTSEFNFVIKYINSQISDKSIDKNEYMNELNNDYIPLINSIISIPSRDQSYIFYINNEDKPFSEIYNLDLKVPIVDGWGLGDMNYSNNYELQKSFVQAYANLLTSIMPYNNIRIPFWEYGYSAGEEKTLYYFYRNDNGEIILKENDLTVETQPAKYIIAYEVPKSKETKEETKEEVEKKEDGFYIIEDKKYNQFKNEKTKIEILTITKDLPPSIIELKYLTCKIRYQINKKSNYGFLYNNNMYTPVDESKNMLRYSESGIVTEDYIPCRITLYGKDSFNPYTFTIQEKIEIKFDFNEFEKNKKKFNDLNISNYKFNFNWTCFCIKEYTSIVELEVKNNKLINKHKDITYYTLNDLFTYVSKTLDNTPNPYQINIKYNDEYGYIEQFYIDKNMNIADEEIGFNANNLKIINEINIDVNKTKQKTFTLLNEKVNLYNSNELLNTTEILRVDEDNSKLITENKKDNVKTYMIYKSQSKGINNKEYPYAMEMINNYKFDGSNSLSVLKISQFNNLLLGNTELYINNKDTMYIHRGIQYLGIPIYIDVKFQLVESNKAKLHIAIYLSNNNDFLLSYLFDELKDDISSKIDNSNSGIKDNQLNVIINFKPGDTIDNLLKTGLSFLYNNNENKKGIEFQLDNTNLQISTLNKNHEIIYTVTDPDGKDENTLDDITKYIISNNKITYESNTTGNASDNMLALVFTNGVTVEYKSLNNVYEYALQASGDREYPYFTIHGKIPQDFMKLDKGRGYDDSNALTRLNKVPFGKKGYINIVK